MARIFTLPIRLAKPASVSSYSRAQAFAIQSELSKHRRQKPLADPFAPVVRCGEAIAAAEPAMAALGCTVFEGELDTTFSI